ncbi:MAG: 4Fe-4S binding protein [Candidatus Methanoperedens sp.]|nr:4Fe-4S binding protein [Candidatus Methanoperedens sp.]MCZ7396144.1 4Fe-4S binding protein [Candidatus Methanoperedens sp.]
MKRSIVSIDEEKCNGCGLCIPSCAEGAIKLINGKAKLADERFCDGLGACLGHCPQDAITVIEREAPEFDEAAVKKHLMPKKPVMASHGCPGSMAMDFRSAKKANVAAAARQNSELRQWPVQLTLVSHGAPYFRDAELLVAADCVPFAYPNFHSDFLAGKSLIIGCPKLDDAGFYVDKLTELLKNNNIRGITLVNMEVPCCFGLQRIVEEAVAKSGKVLPIQQTVITIKGEKQQ